MSAHADALAPKPVAANEEGGHQIQTPVVQRPPAVGCTEEEDGDLTVLRASVPKYCRCTPADRVPCFETCVVHDQDGVGIAGIAEHLIGVPLDPVQHPWQGRAAWSVTS
ncbi:hypothetical protein ADK77_38555 [Streptomyces antibioticus]|nr:hypothetical protein ADK77_38555 [Streptomyces antibioticus]